MHIYVVYTTSGIWLLYYKTKSIKRAFWKFQIIWVAMVAKVFARMKVIEMVGKDGWGLTPF